MKDIMADYSSASNQDVPSFVYIPPSDSGQQLLLELNRPLDDLADMLLDAFAGQSISVKHIFDQHQVGKPYVMRNYQKVLKELEASGRIKINPPADKRVKRKGEPTLTVKAIVTFPRNRV